jgi:hypothetical protein
MEQISLMNISNTSKYILGIFAAAGILAGCSGSQSSLSPSGPAIGSDAKGAPSPALLQRLSIAAHPSLEAPRPNRSKSWMSPDVLPDRHHHKKKLLYISSFYSDEVDVYDYKSLKLKGTITGLDNPQGECVDKKGDVFVANTDASDILEYARGATSPTATLEDTGYYPVGCAISPKTGDLAVSNIFSTEDEDGNVVIFPKATGSGTSYTVPGLEEAFFCAYDNDGNLFVDGHPVLFGSGFAFAELPSGSSNFEAVTLNQSIEFPGGVGYDGKYVTVDDQDDDNTVYQFTISGTSGTKEGSSSFSGPSDMLGYSFVVQKYNGKQSTTLVGPDGVGEATYIFNYPAGGSSRASVEDGLDDNSGAVVTPGSNE